MGCYFGGVRSKTSELTRYVNRSTHKHHPTHDCAIRSNAPGCSLSETYAFDRTTHFHMYTQFVYFEVAVTRCTIAQ